MLKREDHLDEAGDACRFAGVTDVALDRSDGAVVLLERLAAKDLGEREHLEDIVPGAGRVGLDVRNLVGTHVGDRQRFANRADLRCRHRVVTPSRA